MTDHDFQVESIVMFHWINRKECITLWWITLSIFNYYLKHDFIIPYVEKGSFLSLVLIHKGIVTHEFRTWVAYFIYIAFDKRVTFWLHCAQSLSCACVCCIVCEYDCEIVICVPRVQIMQYMHIHKAVPDALRPKRYSRIKSNRNIVFQENFWFLACWHVAQRVWGIKIH